MLRSMCPEGTALPSGHAAGVCRGPLSLYPAQDALRSGALQPLSRCSRAHSLEAVHAQLALQMSHVCLFPQPETPDQRCLMLLMVRRSC